MPFVLNWNFQECLQREWAVWGSVWSLRKLIWRNWSPWFTRLERKSKNRWRLVTGKGSLPKTLLCLDIYLETCWPSPKISLLSHSYGLVLHRMFPQILSNSNSRTEKKKNTLMPHLRQSRNHMICLECMKIKLASVFFWSVHRDDVRRRETRNHQGEWRFREGKPRKIDARGRYTCVSEQNWLDTCVQVPWSFDDFVFLQKRYISRMKHKLSLTELNLGLFLLFFHLGSISFQGVLRQVPLVGSLLNWWSPPPSEQIGVKGRTFNLASGSYFQHLSSNSARSLELTFPRY